MRMEIRVSSIEYHISRSEFIRTWDTAEVLMRGSALMFKKDGIDGPSYDWQLPPMDAALALVERTPLPATIRIITESGWDSFLVDLGKQAEKIRARSVWLEEFRAGKASREAQAVQASEQLGNSSYTAAQKEADESVLRYAAQKGQALVWYNELDEELRRTYRFPSGANLNIELRVADAAANDVASWLRLAATHTAYLPHLDLDQMSFSAAPEITPHTGTVSWATFLDGRLPAVAESYDFVFRR